MEDFKIKLFEEEYKIHFPQYNHLSENDCIQLINRISKKYNLSSINLIEEISVIQSFVENIDVLENFRLIDTLTALSIKPLSKIYINWNQFDNIDRFDILDFDKYFYDIWFSVSDDIELFDDSLDWIISIRHHGSLFIKNNPRLA